MQETKNISCEKLPVWWDLVPESFKMLCNVVNIREWELSIAAQTLRLNYEKKFGVDKVTKRIPNANWQRADYCSQLVSLERPENIIDIGSGLGEFVNLFAKNNIESEVSSVDIKDYDLWYDDSGRINRIYSSLLDLDNQMKWDVVTCFEVIEHLDPSSLEKSVEKLRSLAKRRLYVSVPFMEPLPLYRGHFTRFDESLLKKLFPDAKFTIFSKGGNSKDKVLAWILCEIPIG